MPVFRTMVAKAYAKFWIYFHPMLLEQTENEDADATALSLARSRYQVITGHRR